MYNTFMPQPLKTKLPPLNTPKETIGECLARLRKQRGTTQNQIAEKIGIKQALVSKYEKDKLKLSADMLIRFSKALNVSADEILGLKESKEKDMKPTLKLIKRFNKINSLTPNEQKA